MLAAVSGHELEPRINAELMQSVIEIATPVCRAAGDVVHELARLRSFVTDVARERLLRVGSAGTHPFSLFERQRITAKNRYRELIDRLQYIARRELIFGMHVHVAIDDPEKAIKVVGHPPAPRLGTILARPGADHQLRTFSETGDMTSVAREIADVTEAIPVAV
jgi:gamma-glutamyl:cysteine ligase YbdK (ATP-grasp superfamily)